MKIEKTKEIGFCFGVKRAIGMLEEAASDYGSVETLGAVVHNQQVLQRLGEMGIKVAETLGDIRGTTVAISAHGVSPRVEEELLTRQLHIIDTTCPFVHRAQLAAQRLAESGFFVLIYGDANHPEVRGILGWADNKGTAMLDEKAIATLKPVPYHLGLLSQTTQIPAHFTEFAKCLIDSALVKGSEIRIIDTICHDIRNRQEEAYNLASRVDMMLVIGSRTSANTKHLAELCSKLTITHLIETAEELQESWFVEKQALVGVTAGTSTSEQTINEILAHLEAL